MLLTAVLGLSVLLPPAELTLNPTDDIWVYPHASDPQKDPFLRVWGAAEQSVPGAGDDPAMFSFSYLKFEIKDLPEDAVLESATLTLYHTPNPPFTLEVAKEAPVEVRPVRADFNEKTWTYEMLTKVMPEGSKEALIGSAAPTAWKPDEAFPIAIDLMKLPGRFASYLEAARKEPAPTLRFALCAALDPSAGATRSVYKFHSKDGEARYRPVLKLVYKGS